MINDFLIAILLGFLTLSFFWFFILIFIYFRKPPNSKLTFRLFARSLLVFVIGIVLLFFFNDDSFF